MTAQNLTLIAAGTLTALVAGLFFAFVVAVNVGIGRLGDDTYLRAMQSINTAIQNALFSLAFLGPMVLLPVTTFLHADEPGSARFILLLAATVLYVVAVFGITAAGNVPLNNRLAQVDMSRLTPQKAAEVRGWFEGPWQRLHVIRTLAVILVVVLLFAAGPA